MAITSADIADQYAGLTDDTSTNQATGDLGDGSGDAQDWLESAIGDASAAAGLASQVVTMANGGKSTLTNTNGTPVMTPIKQGGNLSTQGSANPWYKTIPIWGWVVGAGLLLVAFASLFIPSGKK